MYKGNSLAKVQNVKTEKNKKFDDWRDEIVDQADGVLAEIGGAKLARCARCAWRLSGRSNIVLKSRQIPHQLSCLDGRSVMQAKNHPGEARTM